MQSAGQHSTHETIGELLSVDFPKRDLIIGAFLALGEILMLFAYRGVGKTFCALTLAHRIAAGADWLTFGVPQRRRVVLFDGEMGRETLAHRLWAVERGSDVSCPCDGIRIVTYEHTRTQTMPNLADESHQRWYEHHAADADVIIIDNLLTCSYATSARDDDVLQWERIQKLLIRWRSQRKAVILIHHAGKSFQQLGTSRRENICDAIIELRRTQLKRADDGGNFELHFDKTRKFYGPAAAAHYVEFTDIDDSVVWRSELLADARESAVLDAWNSGIKSPTIIAAKFNLPAALVQEILSRKPKYSEGDLF